MIAAAVAAAVLAASPVAYLQGRQLPTGAFAEPGGAPSAELTAWAALGLRAAGADTGRALTYLEAHEGEASPQLVGLAEAALGREPRALLARLPERPRLVNDAIWTILALRQAGREVPRPLTIYVLRSQTRSGGFGWARRVAPDSNDTAAAVQALRAAGVRGTPIRRALVFLRRFENRDGGFALTQGRGSDAQSTAWAIQAFLAAGAPPPRAAFAYLRRLQRRDGSFRYSARYGFTPAWVTAQVLPALYRRPFPLR